MKKDKNYRLAQRERKIRERKKKLSWWDSDDGRLDKNNTSCSCALCRPYKIGLEPLLTPRDRRSEEDYRLAQRERE